MMKFVKAILVSCFSMLVGAVPAVGDTNAFLTQGVANDKELMQNILYRVHQVSSKDERKRLAKIQVDVVDHWNPNLAVSLYNSKGRHIKVSVLFLAQLHVASRAFAIEFSDPSQGELVERYIEYRGWMMEYPNKKLPSLDEFSGISKELKYRLDNDPKLLALQDGIFVSAMTVVMLHELGHQMTNGFYSGGDSFSHIRNIEKRADEWAREKSMQMGLPPMLGMTLLARILSVYDQPEFMHSKGRSHPEPMFRLVSMLEGSKSELLDQYRRAIELGNKFNKGNELALAEINRHSPETLLTQHFKIREYALKKANENRNRNIDWYKKKIAELPDKHKAAYMYPLAHMYMRGITTEKNDELARKYFSLSAIGGHKWAAIWAGTLYEQGWGGKKDIKMARKFYEKAASGGHRSGALFLSAFNKRH